MFKKTLLAIMPTVGVLAAVIVIFIAASLGPVLATTVDGGWHQVEAGPDRLVFEKSVYFEEAYEVFHLLQTPDRGTPTALFTVQIVDNTEDAGHASTAMSDLEHCYGQIEDYEGPSLSAGQWSIWRQDIDGTLQADVWHILHIEYDKSGRFLPGW